ncbi:hypothetical protein ALC60_09670 [Trachymyrmex zeteki]|uniref:Uncharacterized protein n=1 Tax=Mycetomoellerius zeteki TaxID=64791 RepID=A0A151WU95_9HYME|nr:hypothetical protein ALC60_09670 [Trachymyrmex zeteki]
MADEDGAIPTALNPVTVCAKFSRTSDIPSGADSREPRNTGYSTRHIPTKDENGGPTGGP